MMQSEEQAMLENSEAIPHSLAMFASNTKNNGGNSQTHGSNGRGRGLNGYDREEVEEGIVIAMVVLHRITLLTGTTFLIRINPTLSLVINPTGLIVIVPYVKFVVNLDIKHWIVTIEWILQLWLQLLMLPSPAAKIHG